MAVILGIDPGSRKTGFGIINHNAGRSDYITSGVIRLPDGELPERLRVIYESVTELSATVRIMENRYRQVQMGRPAVPPSWPAWRYRWRFPSTRLAKSSNQWWVPARPTRHRFNTW